LAAVSLEEQVVTTVRGVVRAEGVEGRCRIEVEPAAGEAPTIVSLIPADPKATTLRVQLDREAQITFYVGRHGTVAEAFDRSEARLLKTVRSFALLAISGNYREYVKQRPGPGHKAISRFVWPNTGKAGGFSNNVLLPRRWSALRRKGWQEEIYDAY
jgi:hypothetical protein